MKVVRKENSPRYERDAITSYLLVGESTTAAKQVTTTLVEMAPGGSQRMHSHENEQCYVILEGTGEMTVGDETQTVATGDTVFIPSHAPHGLLNTGKGRLVYISAASPVFGAKTEAEFWPELLSGS
jgi:mannose-6-phosphate isomerase-like protein (cupin superfamily)